MCPEDTILIGGYCFFKSTFDILIPVITAIIGVIVGGWIANYSSSTLQKREWKRQDFIEQAKPKREAIEIALQWIQPMRSYLIKAEAVASSYLFGHLNIDELRERYPRLITNKLVEFDVPAHLIPYLPEHTYDRGYLVNKLFEDYYYELQDADKSKPQDNLVLTRQSQVIREIITKLETELQAEFDSTFRYE
jgi:hypothetical protein